MPNINQSTNTNYQLHIIKIIQSSSKLITKNNIMLYYVWYKIFACVLFCYWSNENIYKYFIKNKKRRRHEVCWKTVPNVWLVKVNSETVDIITNIIPIIIRVSRKNINIISVCVNDAYNLHVNVQHIFYKINYMLKI